LSTVKRNADDDAMENQPIQYLGGRTAVLHERRPALARERVVKVPAGSADTAKAAAFLASDRAHMLTVRS
jgi:hypothetical protein